MYFSFKISSTDRGTIPSSMQLLPNIVQDFPLPTENHLVSTEYMKITQDEARNTCSSKTEDKCGIAGLKFI